MDEAEGGYPAAEGEGCFRVCQFCQRKDRGQWRKKDEAYHDETLLEHADVGDA